MADTSITPPRSASVPRIYYYKTRHYRPEAQKSFEAAKARIDDDPATPHSGTSAREVPLEPVQTLRFKWIPYSFNRQTFMQVSLAVLIALLAIWWIFFFSPGGITPDYPQPTPGDKGDNKFNAYWEQKMRVIAQDEIRLALSEKFAQINNIIGDIKAAKEAVDKIMVSGGPAAVLVEYQKRIDALTNDLNSKVSEINSRLTVVSQQAAADTTKQINALRSEIEQNIAKAVKDARLKLDDSQTQEQISGLSSKVDSMQEQVSANKDAAKRIGDTVSALDASITAFKEKAATKDSVAALQAQMANYISDSEAKLSETTQKVNSLEDKIKGWVTQTINSDFIKREVLKVISTMPPMEDTRVAQLIEQVTSMKAELKALAEQVAIADPASLPQSPLEVVERAKPTVTLWIKKEIEDSKARLIDEIKKEVPSSSSPGKTPSQTPEQLFEAQKKLIEAWIDQRYLKDEIPKLVNAANQKMAGDVQGKVEGVKDQLNKMEQRLSKPQPIEIDAKTRSIIVENLRQSGVVKGLTADEVEKIVQHKLDLFAADRVNMTDYALETGGAKIFNYGTSPNYRSGFWHWISGSATHSPTVLLSPVGSMRGKCWSFKGDKGYVTIQLPFPVKVTSFTLEHIPRSLAVTPGAAPRQFQVLGLRNPQDSEADLLGNYEYILGEENTVQNFPIQLQHVPANSTLTYPYIVLSISSNYGNPEFTCVYRFRVHGAPGVEVEPSTTTTPTTSAAAAPATPTTPTAGKP